MSTSSSSDHSRSSRAVPLRVLACEGMGEASAHHINASSNG